MKVNDVMLGSLIACATNGWIFEGAVQENCVPALRAQKLLEGGYLKRGGTKSFPRTGQWRSFYEVTDAGRELVAKRLAEVQASPFF